MVNRLIARPVPLIDADRRVIVLWSPKSACTAVYVWFAAICGFLEEVRKFGFPHTHRAKVWKVSERYQQSLGGDTSGYHVVKVIRDPYTRATSIFRHAVRNSLLKQESISFGGFLRMLAQGPMSKQDIHFRPQFHKFERERKPDTIINISKTDLFSELNALEARMGWPITDFAALTWFHKIEAARYPNRLETHDDRHFAKKIARAKFARDTPFPSDEAFLTPPAKRLIEQIYRVDFKAYRDYL